MPRLIADGKRTTVFSVFDLADPEDRCRPAHQPCHTSTQATIPEVAGSAQNAHALDFHHHYSTSTTTSQSVSNATPGPTSGKRQADASPPADPQIVKQSKTNSISHQPQDNGVGSRTQVQDKTQALTRTA